MAIPGPAIEKAIRHEDSTLSGKVTNISGDRGGVTKWGISSAAYPELNVSELSYDDAATILERDFWSPEMAKLSQEVAEKLFDISVNMNPRRKGGTFVFGASINCFQRALRACGKRVKEDGVLGPNTVAVANLVDQQVLLAAFRSEVAGYYRLIVKGNPTQQKFENGWLNRAYAI